VFQNSDDFSAMGECLKISTSHCVLLEEKGMNVCDLFVVVFFFFGFVCINLLRVDWYLLGLFLSNVVSQIFFPALLEAINNYAKTIGTNTNQQIHITHTHTPTHKFILETNLTKYIAAEKWHSSRWIDPKNAGSAPLQLTESSKFLFGAAQDFVGNISHIITFEVSSLNVLFLHSCCISSFLFFFRGYVSK
jgi:hypothetical protein